MTKRIFRALIGISLVVCLVGMATVFAVLYYYFENQITMEMESEVKYLAASVEEYGQQALDNLPSDAQRVTLIAPDGTVLFDNYADPAQMDNHLNREEVQMALQNGYAQSTAAPTPSGSRWCTALSAWRTTMFCAFPAPSTPRRLCWRA